MQNAITQNPWRPAGGLPAAANVAQGQVAADPAPVQALLANCPAAHHTPLRALPKLAAAAGAGELLAKDESARMGLGSFKALGAAHVIAADAQNSGADLTNPVARKTALAKTRYICASAGNHGLSVAAGARLFGAAAQVFLAAGVPQSFANRLQRLGAQTTRAGATYEESMAAAQAAAQQDNSAILLSDSSWPGYTQIPARVMQGYLPMGAEAARQLPAPPHYIFLQAGVGGMAAAMAAYFRAQYAAAPIIVVAEPDRAPALQASIAAGRPITAGEGESCMGRLDCKAPSHLALRALAQHADYFTTITDAQSRATVQQLQKSGIRTTPSGAAGISALMHHGQALGVQKTSRVLAFITEGEEPA